MNKVIAFSYPRRGLNGTFNTFRLGNSWATKLTRSEVVDLIDAKTKRVLLRATVIGVFTGPMRELATRHARWAHNWTEHPADQRADLLVASMLRRFAHWGPARCSETAICSTIYLREIENDPQHHQAINTA